MNYDSLVNRLSHSILVKDKDTFQENYTSLVDLVEDRFHASSILLDVAGSYNQYVWIADQIENVS